MINQDRLVALFLELVRTDSETGAEGAVAQICRRELETLGLSVTEDDAGKHVGSDSGNLMARLPATAAGQPVLLVNAHMDTVGPGRGVTPVIDGGIIRSDGTTILGADNKSGLAVILEACRCLLELQLPHGEIEIVFTISEEVDLRGAKFFDLSWSRADYGYSLDSNLVGGITVGAPSYNRIDAVIHGLAAHAGVAPQAGLSAAVIAAKALARLPLGKLDDVTTANVGRLSAGVARNVVPAVARLEAEVRSHDPARLERVTADIIRILNEEAAAAKTATPEGIVTGRVEIVQELDFEAFSLAADSPVVARAERAYANAGITSCQWKRMGGSDANVFNAKGLPTAVLGTGQDRVHSLRERISIADMTAAAEALVHLLTAES